MSGYSVIAVTSRDETKTEAASRGADHVFSNSDSDLVKKIRAVVPNLRHAFDTVVTSDTMAKIVECCEKPAKVATAIRYNGPKINGVQITPVYSGEIMGKTMVGLPSAAGLELGKWLWGNLDQWIKSNQITPLEYEELDGLESVQDGLEVLESGTAHRKLVMYVV
jgi:NADPH:quinone reductase-like Zn-dependent oxidoreductase